MSYNKFFKSLIVGRQSEFIVYSKIYEVSESLFRDYEINIYDQISDVDGVDFIIRAKNSGVIHYIEAQVKTTHGSLSYVAKKNSLQSQVKQAISFGSRFLVFAVNSIEDVSQSGVFFFTEHELEAGYSLLKTKSLNLKNLKNRLPPRDYSVSGLKQYIEQSVFSIHS